MRVFRLHIRPSGGLADPELSFAYCMREKLLGVGWQVELPSGKNPTWEEYEALGRNAYGVKGISRVRYLRENVKPGDLIWTRDTRGKYYLGRVECQRQGALPSNFAWQYMNTADGRNADIVNAVRCSQIFPIEMADDVPGKIVSCFRPTRVIQSINDDTAISYSQLLWNQLVENSDFEISNFARADIFSLLDAESVEDVIFIYLQYQGWLIVPHSRKADTMRYEFIAIHRTTYERCAVQVKTGKTLLDMSVLDTFEGHAFLFQSQGLYTGISRKNATYLQPQDIRNFIEANTEIMPHAVKRWMDFLKKYAG